MTERQAQPLAGDAARRRDGTTATTPSKVDADRWRLRVAESVLLTTGDVARLLGVTPNGVRWLERTGQIRCQRTLGGRRLFHPREVEALVVARARRRHPLLVDVRPRMARAALGQLTLPLRLDRRKQAKEVLHLGEVKVVAFRRKRGNVA